MAVPIRLKIVPAHSTSATPAVPKTAPVARHGNSSSGGSGSSRSRGAGLAFGVDLGDDLVRHHGAAITHHQLSQHASRRCGHFEHDLVGFDFDQDFIGSNSFTGFFLPGQHGGFRHGFRQLGDFDFYDGHDGSDLVELANGGREG